jgi:hypothetical protein
MEDPKPWSQFRGLKGGSRHQRGLKQANLFSARLPATLGFLGLAFSLRSSRWIRQETFIDCSVVCCL